MNLRQSPEMYTNRLGVSHINTPIDQYIRNSGREGSSPLSAFEYYLIFKGRYRSSERYDGWVLNTVHLRTCAKRFFHTLYSLGVPQRGGGRGVPDPQDPPPSGYTSACPYL